MTAGETLPTPTGLGRNETAHVLGQANVQKRGYISASAQNLGLLMPHKHRMGTPRSPIDARG